ncbi:hypothetical protein BG006_009713 [Podila minutissima]|uniref:DM2 domain-containing protein n=1 Tax=Podila minutissima TaxID=64525 RepID=A0A9P5VJ45_9FUNG|nr:hypothetical protein BG006_009713 [Podila minutissima]
MANKSSVEQYRSKVTELISMADITTVSAKGIRKQIESLSGRSLEPVKREFDELVMEIYQKITDDIEQSVLNGTTQSNNQGYRQDYYPQHNHQNHHDHNHNHNLQSHAPQPTYAPPQSQAPPQSSFGFSLPPTSYVPPEPEPAPSEDDEADSDASFSSVEDGRSNKKAKVSSSGASKKSAPSSKKKSTSSSSTKSKSKSSSSSSKKDKEKEKEKTKTKRKQPVNDDGTPKVNNFTRPMVISDKLNDVIGHAGIVGVSGRVEMSRPEVVKQLWVYIKSNGLQDESDKRNIKCDSKLKALFGHDQVNCFSMNKYLSGHLSKAEELV